MRPYYEIQSSDVGKRFIKAFGRTWPVVDFIGHIGAYDVGKRVYQTAYSAGDGYFLQVENDSQKAARLAKGA